MPLGVVAPEGVHFPLWGMVVLVIARHEDDRGELEFPADERHAVVPVAVHDVAGQDEQVPLLIGRELALPVRQVPFPQLKMQVRCDLDFHAVPLINTLDARASASPAAFSGISRKAYRPRNR